MTDDLTARVSTDDDYGPFDLDDMPDITAIARNARVAADLLFVDPPPAYNVRVDEYGVTVQGYAKDGMEAWATRHHMAEELEHRKSDRFRFWKGTVEGVEFEAVCEVPS